MHLHVVLEAGHEPLGPTSDGIGPGIAQILKLALDFLLDVHELRRCQWTNMMQW